MTIKYFDDVMQGSDEWFAARCGLLTASQMENIITPAKLQYSQSKEAKAHLHELLSQRITGYTEPEFVGYDMLRGKEDEIIARSMYHEKYAPVQEVGFVTNDKWGFTLGYSPDGLVGDDGSIEGKSKKHKLHLKVLLDNICPIEHRLQIQTGLMVTERKWCDFISYSAGFNMFTFRVCPDPVIQEAILEACCAFDQDIEKEHQLYLQRMADKNIRILPTDRRKTGDEITASDAV